MSVVIIIPARYASTRFPGKPLQLLKGADGIAKPMIEHVWQRAMQVKGVDAIYVATDDERIQTVANAFGAQVVMTDPECANGTERCAEACVSLELSDSDVIINLQGDAPLTPPWFIEALIQTMQTQACHMATPVLQMDAATLEQFKVDRLQGRVGGTTVVFNEAMQALYFSKEVIPYYDEKAPESKVPVYHHVGVYTYQVAALRAYRTWPQSLLERLEGLEQLRFLAQGVPIQCVQVESRGHAFWELNNPSDIALVEAGLALLDRG